MKKYLVCLFLALFLFTSNVFAFEENQAVVRGIRPMGMGGAFTAVADDENAFFYNPAGMAQRRGNLIQIFNIDFAINTEIFDFINFFNDNKSDLENFDSADSDDQTDLLEKINDRIASFAPNIVFSLPNFAYISKPIVIADNYLSWGLGLFTFANAKFKFNQSMVVPNFSYLAEATAVAAVPVSYRINSLEALKIPGKLSLGANIKYIYRGRASETNMSVAEFEDMDIRYQTGSGYGLDFGLIYHLSPEWNFGMQLTDAFYTNIKYDKYEDDKNAIKSRAAYTAGIRPEWNIGAAYFPEKIYYWPGKYFETNKRFIFAADVTDIANNDETLTDSFWKKLHFGAEYKFAPFAVRAGFNSGYPSVGAAVVTNVVQLEYAFYGEEEGRYAGQDPSWFHRILFSVKIGENKGRPYGKSYRKENSEFKDSGKET
ncbi:MAG: hypothetical protein LBL00_00555, partial [Endomicrobium sp.]|nr:hypothetical protein [Endomicrobium sp.]